MSRTYSYGKRKRTGCPHGHCWICGYDPRLKGQKRTQHNNYMKFNILPFIEEI